MAKITKSLSQKVDTQTKKSEILLRFVGGATLVLRAKSGIFIDPKTWNTKSGELKSATFGNAEMQIKLKLNKLCDTIIETFTATDISKINKEWLNMVIDKFHYPERYISPEEVAAQMLFFELYDLYLQNAEICDMRRQHYMVLRRVLQRYELFANITLNIHTIDERWLSDFVIFLEKEHEYCQSSRYKNILKKIPESRTPRPRGYNTIQGFYKRLRAFINWCVESGYTLNSPKKKFKEAQYGTPIYINKEEVRQIIALDLSHRPKLAIQRDIFVFQCQVGCRIGDLYNLRISNIVDDSIQYVPHKTANERHETVVVPLNNTAMGIIERYREEGQQVDKPILPFISEVKYNAAIKETFVLAGITRLVIVRNPLTGCSESKPISQIASSHMARRTFIGTIYKRVKDPNLVCKVSGHKEGSRAFARYRDIDDEMKRELVAMLED